MGKVEENKRLKRGAILDAALQLFTDQGLNKTSISDIAARSGVAKGTFYLYFKDKYDIRNKLVIRQSRRLLMDAYAAMQSKTFPSLEEQFVFITNHILDQLASHHDLLILLSRNLSWGIIKQEFSHADQDDQDVLQTFNTMTRQHGISDTDSAIMFYLLIELAGPAGCNAILYQNPCDLETLKPYLFESVRRIVRQFEEKSQISE